MKRVIIATMAVSMCCSAFSLDNCLTRRFGSGWYEFESSSKNTKAAELPMSSYKKGSIVFLRNDTAYSFYPQKNLDLDSLIVCPEITGLNIEGTFAYDEANGKLYFVKKTGDEATQIYEATADGDKWKDVKLLRIKGAMTENNKIDGSTLAIARYNFSHSGAKGFHNLSLGEGGKRLYFSGDFKAGKGDRDLWYIDLDKDGSWSRPTSVADTLNTAYREDFPLVLGDSALYFASSRPGGQGGMDMYVSRKHQQETEWGPASNLGEVFNSSANDYNIAYNKLAMYFISERDGGKGAADIYYPNKFDCQSNPELPTLSTIEEPKGFNWVLMFFDFNQTVMKPEYERQMDELYSAMCEFPGASFEISGYTDSRGSAEYNLKLSQKRADYIRQLLIQRGINPRNLRSYGRGMANPVIPNAQTEDEHEQNRRVEIKLLNKD